MLRVCECEEGERGLCRPCPCPYHASASERCAAACGCATPLSPLRAAKSRSKPALVRLPPPRPRGPKRPRFHTCERKHHAHSESAPSLSLATLHDVQVAKGNMPCKSQAGPRAPGSGGGGARACLARSPRHAGGSRSRSPIRSHPPPHRRTCVLGGVNNAPPRGRFARGSGCVCVICVVGCSVGWLQRVGPVWRGVSSFSRLNSLGQCSPAKAACASSLSVLRSTSACTSSSSSNSSPSSSGCATAAERR